MDLFTYYPQYRVLVCKPCGYAVPPAHLESHINKNHPHDACRAAGVDPVHSRARKSAALLAGCLQEVYDPLDPSAAKIATPPATDPPIPTLKHYRGYQCSRCEHTLAKTKKAQACLQQHFNSHRLLPRKRGRPGRVADIPEEDKGPMYHEVFCQRFFVTGAQSSFFTVSVATPVQELVKTRPREHADVY
jgi:hypothetical protein